MSSESTMSDALLAMLRCPQDHSSLTWMTGRALNALNKKIEKGDVLHADGRPLTGPLTELLVRDDQRIGYLCQDGVALLNAQDAVTLKT